MKKTVFYLIIILLFASCSGGGVENSTPNSNTNNNNSNSSNSEETTNTAEWLIPLNEVKDGGPGKDGIPSIDKPKFVSANDATFLNNSDLVVGFFQNGEAKAYPHNILNWHEIVNDSSNENDRDIFTINYCPLTGTAFGWKSKTTYGVSGLLYNANLILYDRISDSNWSQLKLECVNGPLIGSTPTLINVVETNWITWKTLYPNTKVLSEDTGFSRNYSVSPYGNYAVSEGFIFKPSILNSALPNKERVFAIINGSKSKVYQFSNFNTGKSIIESFNGKNYLIVGNGNLINAFKLSANQLSLTFEYSFNGSEEFFKDNEGNVWNVFGEAIEGPRKGDKLQGAKSVVSYWFAIAVFYPDPEIYNG